MASIKRMQGIEAAKVEASDKATAGFVKQLRKVLARSNSRILATLQDLAEGDRLVTSTFNLQRAVAARADIERILNEAGYPEAVTKLVSVYDRVAELTASGLEAGGIATEFTSIDAEALTALKNVDLARWERFGGHFVDTLHGQVMDAVVGGVTFDELTRSIEDSMLGAGEDDPRMLSQAETIANTLTQSFDRAITNKKAQDAGISTFVYVGPDDQITRPFCHAVLDGGGDGEFNIPAVDGDPPVYTDDQIAEMDNGQGLAVFQFGGGYNCRHKFRPISVQVAQEALA